MALPSTCLEGDVKSLREKLRPDRRIFPMEYWIHKDNVSQPYVTSQRVADFRNLVSGISKTLS